jgi:hypothetical protein
VVVGALKDNYQDVCCIFLILKLIQSLIFFMTAQRLELMGLGFALSAHYLSSNFNYIYIYIYFKFCINFFGLQGVWCLKLHSTTPSSFAVQKHGLFCDRCLVCVLAFNVGRVH